MTATCKVDNFVIHVVDGEGPNLLGHDWMGKLNVSVNHHVGACIPAGVDELHADLFN